MGAQRYVGTPLTGVRYNGVENRVEQYFENLGFFQNLEGNTSVQLMAYGRIACAEACSAQANPAAIVAVDLPYGEPFIGIAEQLGKQFVGERIAGPYQRANGSLEVIYENLVLYSESGSQVVLPRPIMAELGVLPEPLVNRLENPNLSFIEIESGYGYNVPYFFIDYINQQGGFAIVGQPISELKLQGDGSANQCFANTCLSYSIESGVVPLPVGAEYKLRFYDQPSVENTPQQMEIRIQVWEDFSQISSAETQVIHASLYAGRQLLSSLQPYLEITLPGGGTSIYQFPITDNSGQTQISVPPIHAQNGTLIPYKVCLEGFGAQEVCASESYMIWGN
jgi:hypothetical protein